MQQGTGRLQDTPCVDDVDGWDVRQQDDEEGRRFTWLEIPGLAVWERYGLVKKDIIKRLLA